MMQRNELLCSGKMGDCRSTVYNGEKEGAFKEKGGTS